MQITSGIVPSAQKVLIYGIEGIGKSTLAAEFDHPLFIDTEGSTKHMDVRRLDAPESWRMLLEEVRYVYLNPSVCRTLVIDTADWAERLCVSHICAVHQVDSIEKILNGYGKGYVVLAEEFGKLLNLLTDVVDRGVNVVLTAHAQIKKFEQPDEALAYDRWILKLGKQTAPLLKEWADMVLFANYKTFAVKSESTKTAKAAGGKRTLFTSHRPAWDAKNRHGLPDELSFEDGKGNPVMPQELLAAVPPIALVESAPEAPKEEVVVADRDGETKVETPAAPVPAADVPAHMKKLYQLMAENDVTELQIRQAVAARGFFPVDASIHKYPADFVDGVLVTAWPQVLEFIRDNEGKQQ